MGHFSSGEDHVGSVQQRNTYEFCNIRVKNDKYQNEIFVSTIRSSTSITQSTPFAQVLPVAIETSNTMVKGEILGICKVSDYLSSAKCHKEVDVSNQIATCTSCHFKQKQKSCKKIGTLKLSLKTPKKQHTPHSSQRLACTGIPVE